MKIKNDKRKEVLSALESQVRLALEAVGTQAVTDVSTDPIPVDTGLMKNSITFALSGEGPKIGSYSADKSGKTGGYHGQTPSEPKNTIYIGTNVEYAKYVELGTSKMTARPFMMPKLKANLGNYKEILQKYLKE